jgi:hypothetical protein
VRVFVCVYVWARVWALERAGVYGHLCERVRMCAVGVCSVCMRVLKDLMHYIHLQANVTYPLWCCSILCVVCAEHII